MMLARSNVMISLAIALLLGGCTTYYTGKQPSKLNAKAMLAGPGITGQAQLLEEYEGRVRIKLTIEGTADSKLKPGRHGIHIHEVGSCEPFSAAKGHFDGNVDAQVNPDANVSPGLANHPYHLGDLPNLLVSRITLSEGLNTVFDKDGSAFVVHELEDKYLPDPPTKDAPGGARIACGVITKG
jgi:superoxide dismutase, Cu-Zn family